MARIPNTIVFTADADFDRAVPPVAWWRRGLIRVALWRYGGTLPFVVSYEWQDRDE